MNPLPSYTIVGETLTTPALVFEGWTVPRRIQIQRDIFEVVCEVFGQPIHALKSDRRSRAISWPRMAAMYLFTELTECSLPEIARRFGGRDHTTIMYAARRVPEIAANDPEYAAKLSLCFDKLRGTL